MPAYYRIQGPTIVIESRAPEPDVASLMRLWSLLRGGPIAVVRMPDAPWVSLVVCGTIYTVVVLVFQNVSDLAVADVTLYAAMMSLELMSFLVLRRREPELARPFKLKGGWSAAVVVCALPLLCVIAGAYYRAAELGFWSVVGKPLVMMAIVPLVYPLVLWRRRNQSGPKA